MNEPLDTTYGSENVFKDLGFPDEEAENLKLRAGLMSEVRKFATGITQAEAARILGITQPRLTLLLKGKIDKFSLDALVNMLGKAGMRIEMKVRKAA